MRLNSFIQGLNTRIHASLLPPTAAVEFSDIDNSSGSIRPFKAHADRLAGAADVEHYINNSTAVAQDVSNIKGSNHLDYKNELFTSGIVVPEVPEVPEVPAIPTKFPGAPDIPAVPAVPAIPATPKPSQIRTRDAAGVFNDPRDMGVRAFVESPHIENRFDPSRDDGLGVNHAVGYTQEIIVTRDFPLVTDITLEPVYVTREYGYRRTVHPVLRAAIDVTGLKLKFLRVGINDSIIAESVDTTVPNTSLDEAGETVYTLGADSFLYRQHNVGSDSSEWDTLEGVTIGITREGVFKVAIKFDDRYYIVGEVSKDNPLTVEDIFVSQTTPLDAVPAYTSAIPSPSKLVLASSHNAISLTDQLASDESFERADNKCLARYAITKLENGLESVPLDIGGIEIAYNQGLRFVSIIGGLFTTDNIKVYRVCGSESRYSLLDPDDINLNLISDPITVRTALSFTDKLARSNSTRVLNTLKHYPPEFLGNKIGMTDVREVIYPEYFINAYGRLFAIVGDKLYWSLAGEVEYWAKENFVPFYKDITGLIQVSQGILVFTKDETHLLAGTGAENQPFQKLLITKEQGCISPRSCSFIKNFPVWISKSGICTLENQRVVVLSRQAIDWGKFTTGAGDFVKALTHDEIYYVVYADKMIHLDLRFQGPSYVEYKNSKVTNLFRSRDDKLYGFKAGLVEMFAGDTYVKAIYKSPIFVEELGFSAVKSYNKFYFQGAGTVKAGVVNELGNDIANLKLLGFRPNENLVQAESSKQRANGIQFNIEISGGTEAKPPELTEINYSVTARTSDNQPIKQSAQPQRGQRT